MLLAHNETEGQFTQLMYLRILLGLVQDTSCLPDDKLLALWTLLRKVIDSKMCTLKEIQALLDHLNFTCTVMAPGHTFCEHLTCLT